jgi:flagellar M-ring protein FliF
MTPLERFRAIEPGRQVLVAGLVLAVLCALLFGGYFFLLRRPYEVLFTNLRTMDAATIVAELDKRKVPYRLTEHGTTILVPAKQVDATRLSVMSEDLPLKGAVGFELFNKSDMGLTEFAQRINYQRALQGELARTIMTMDSVDSARIHLSIAEPTIFRDDRRPSKASVTLIPRRGMTLSSDTVAGVRRLVAAAVQDLQPADVVVLDAEGRVVSVDAPVGPPASAGPTDAATGGRQAIEQYYAARIRAVLQRSYPAADLQVTVLALPEGGQLSDELFEQWTPANRGFPLNVAVGIAPPLTPEVQDAVRAAVAEATRSNQSLNDVVIVAPKTGEAVIADASVAVPTPQTSAPVEPAKVGATALSLRTGIFLVLLVLLIVAIGLLFVRRRSQGALSEDQRGDYARRLQGLLDGEDGHVAPPG